MSKLINDAMHKKRYGQYFSGRNVAELLTALLPNDRSYSTVIDPMAGSGDLLEAILPKTAIDAKILGVEIDEPVADLCQNRLPNIEVDCEDVFQSKKIIIDKGWDLVITNPPYVRYQLQNEDQTNMPSGALIRKNLCELITKLPYLGQDEIDLLRRIVKGYSGLADMSVPSWILCTALVKKEGNLAMVVPETWLNRDYANPIHYLLLKWFEIKLVVQDINACWFDNALVRTCLIVAQKKSIVPLSRTLKKRTLIIDLSEKAIGEHSLVDRLTWNEKNGYEALAELISKKKNIVGENFMVRNEKTTELFSHIFDAKRNNCWILPKDNISQIPLSPLPIELSNILGDSIQLEYVTLEDMGLRCGQGMRTGANDFFYVKILDDLGDEYLIEGKCWLSKRDGVRISKDHLIRCLKKRGEVDGLIVNYEQLKNRVLYLENSIRSIDKTLCDETVRNIYNVVPKSIEEYITAATYYVNNNGNSFKEYSAVKTNEKKGINGYIRFWYMLPKLMSRHIPSLCITRVCSTQEECLYIPQSVGREIVVDANFVTISSQSERISRIGLALLNSTWSRCYMEIICTVMGGGALKVEANHVKKILFPKLSANQLSRLKRCGDSIIKQKKMNPKLQLEIDGIIFGSLKKSIDVLFDVKEILARKLKERGAKI